MYKMKGSRRKMKTMKRKVRMSKKRNHRSKRYRKSFRGGYAQYQNNLPMTGNYSTGGILNPNQLALANPVPYQTLSNCVNCKDNYNHYTNKGFPSAGH